MLILDTDHITLLQRAGAEGSRVRQRLENAGEEANATIVSFQEQTKGWLDRSARARGSIQHVEAYVRLEAHLRDYCRITVIGFDSKAAAEYEALRKSGIRMGTLDLRIAAIALAHDATVLTRNLSDFGQVPGLRVEDWST